MAHLLHPDTSREPKTLRTLLVSAAILIALAAAAFAIFYRHENHAPAEITALRSLALPLHTTYTHAGKTAAGPEGGEDTTYIVAAVRVVDRADVPLFIKDITASLALADGTPMQITRIKARDMDRLLEIVPTLKPLLQEIAVPPLQPEQTIPAKSTAEGYVVLQIAGPQRIWDERKSAAITLDFYHQDPETVTIPK